MDLDDVKQILALVREHDLAEFELERDGLKVRVRKAGREMAVAPPLTPLALPEASLPVPASGPAPLASQPEVQPPAAETLDAVDLGVIKSPIVGTFYRSPEPGAPAFVEIGTTVKKGQVLCIIEAMKLMNEIDSEYDGEIVNVYVESGQPVQYGERLFAIRTR